MMIVKCVVAGESYRRRHGLVTSCVSRQVARTNPQRREMPRVVVQLQPRYTYIDFPVSLKRPADSRPSLRIFS